ncbi:MAG: beta-lactamase family protein [Acidobacteria bacterium]|nr:beta-lactamase family protein [Acidobacteriota bacterium]
MTRARAIGALALAMALGIGFGFGFSLKGEEGKRISAAGAPPAAGARPRALEEISSVFKSSMSEAGAVGAGLIVVRGSKTLLSSYVGLADRERGVAASPDIIWHWASITKTFTAVRLMQLRDRGKLALSDPIVKYVPELRAVHDAFGDVSEITLRHLLSHSAGFRSPTFPWGGDRDWHPAEPTRWEQVAAMLPYTEILFKPGSKYSYSNPGIVFLGRTIEALTGDDYEVAMAKDVFRPLGLSKAFYDRAPYDLEKDMARGYEGEIGAVKPTRANFDSGITVSNGGLDAPLPALAAWLAFLAGDGPQILSRASLEEMWTPVLPTEKPGESIGLCFFLREAGGTRWVGHSGDQNGFRSRFWLDPKTKVGFVAVMNTSATKGGKDLAKEADARLFEAFVKAAPALAGN